MNNPGFIQEYLDHYPQYTDSNDDRLHLQIGDHAHIQRQDRETTTNK